MIRPASFIQHPLARAQQPRRWYEGVNDQAWMRGSRREGCASVPSHRAGSDEARRGGVGGEKAARRGWATLSLAHVSISIPCAMCPEDCREGLRSACHYSVPLTEPLGHLRFCAA